MKSHAAWAALAAVAMVAGCAPAPKAGAVSQAATAGTSAAGTPSGGTAVAGAATAAAGGAVGTATTASSAATAGLVNALTGQLGITDAQALGGAGAVFSMAQDKLSPTDFTRLSGMVPGIDQFLAAAPAASAVTGGSAGLMGGRSIGSMATLASQFQSLGMNTSMMSKFVPVLFDYVQGTGGSAALSLLQTAFR
jgi:hypothetical protein